MTGGRRARIRIAAAWALSRFGPAPSRAGAPSARRARARTASGPPQTGAQRLGGEERLAGPRGLDRGADRLQLPQRPLPGGLGADRVGRHQDQRRAAREPLGEPHPGADAKRLRRPRGLAEHLWAARLWRQRHRPSEQLPPLAQGAAKLQAGDEGAGDEVHLGIEHMFV